jgi:hypothetical protein
MNGGNAFARPSALVEQALLTTSSFGFALVLTRPDSTRSNMLFRYGSLAAGGPGMVLAAINPLVLYAPLVTARPVDGGIFVNPFSSDTYCPRSSVACSPVLRCWFGCSCTGQAPAHSLHAWPH